jgi:hypothetical protein
MGHTRLGSIPKTYRWPELAEMFESVASTAYDLVPAAAAKTLDTVEQGLQRVPDDPGLTYTFTLLAQIAAASHSDDWERQLRDLNVRLPADASPFDLTAEMQAAIDEHLDAKPGLRTDLAEIAQAAAGEALLQALAPEAISLFDETDDLRGAVARSATRGGFGKLARSFFAGFTTRYINFYLSRLTAKASGNSPFDSIQDISEFNRALATHAFQTARIVEDFSGHWFSKAVYRKELDLSHTRRFIAVAIRKLRKEFEQQKARG